MTTSIQKNETQVRLLAHYRQFPALEVTDLFKYLFQSAYGCEHLIADEESVIARIREEFRTRNDVEPLKVEPLDGIYSRVPFSFLVRGLSPETLGKLFCRSAKPTPNGQEMLEEKLDILRTMIESGTIPLPLSEFDTRRASWREEGYPAIHHSERFRSLYHPTYRVISNEYIPLLPLLTEIDRLTKQETLIVAIEGRSASGKTTLATLLSSLYDCNVFHMDDFFLLPEQRTEERLSQIGGNVDRERFLSEILLPLRAEKPVSFRRFDCSAQLLGHATTMPKKQLNIVEGSYAMHPALAHYYDLSVFLDVTPERQHKRILHRNSPTLAARFFAEWIPLEEAYFSSTSAKDRCDFSLFFGE